MKEFEEILAKNFGAIPMGNLSLYYKCMEEAYNKAISDAKDIIYYNFQNLDEEAFQMLDKLKK